MRRVLALLFVGILCAPACAGFFLDRDAAEEEAKTLGANYGFYGGGGVSFSYYLSDFDFAFEGLSAYRFKSDFGISANVSVGVSEPVHEIGLELDRYIGEDDYVGLGASGVLFRRDGEYRIAPRVFIDYARNMKPWPRARFALQAKIRISYLIGETLGRRELYETKEAYTVFSGSLALLFF